jgi:hypothetical protein
MDQTRVNISPLILVFPNAFDRSLGRTAVSYGVAAGSVGCYAMTDYQMEEIYALVDEAFKGGQNRIQLAAFPFKTTQNLTSLRTIKRAILGNAQIRRRRRRCNGTTAVSCGLRSAVCLQSDGY